MPLILASLAISASLACAWLSRPTAPPGLYPEPEHRDLGIVPPESEQVVEFTFVNRFPDEVHIDRVHPGCSCTKYELSTEHLKPGERAKLMLRINVGGAPNKIRQTAFISYSRSRSDAKPAFGIIRAWISMDVAEQATSKSPDISPLLPEPEINP